MTTPQSQSSQSEGSQWKAETASLLKAEIFQLSLFFRYILQNEKTETQTLKTTLTWRFKLYSLLCLEG